MNSIKFPWRHNERAQERGRDREQRPVGGSSDAYAVALEQCEPHAERELEQQRVEIALISPPDRTVLDVLQGMRRDGGAITDIFSGVMPFVFAYILALLILMRFPDIALRLPRVMK
jgi:hypothetical protein